MKASKARRLSAKVNPRNLSPEIRGCLDQIRAYAVIGNFNTLMSKELTKETEDYLKKLGYSILVVKTIWFGKLTLISWESK